MKRLLIVGLFVLSITTPAAATTIVYTDRAAFEIAAGAVDSILFSPHPCEQNAIIGSGDIVCSGTWAFQGGSMSWFGDPNFGGPFSEDGYGTLLGTYSYLSGTFTRGFGFDFLGLSTCDSLLRPAQFTYSDRSVVLAPGTFFGVLTDEPGGVSFGGNSFLPVLGCQFPCFGHVSTDGWVVAVPDEASTLLLLSLGAGVCAVGARFRRDARGSST